NKVAAARSVNIFFYLFVIGEPILGLINGTVTFELKLDEIPKEITWKFYEDKVCEIDSTSDVCFLSYNGRANINKDNGSLTISNLQNNDTGKYTAEIHQTTVKEFTFELEVLGCHSHIGLIPAVIFMILIPVTAYGLFKALSKRRKEETPEAEKLMKAAIPAANQAVEDSISHGVRWEAGESSSAREAATKLPRGGIELSKVAPLEHT
ncbi:LFA3 protein, partial [Polypterus senegalus]